MPKAIKHWTPRYLWSRLGNFCYDRTNPSAPWLTPQAIGLLTDWLKSSDVGAECGAGRSTLWFAQRVRQLTSIESERDWWVKVGASIQAAGLTNVTLHLAPMDDPAAAPGMPRYVQHLLDLPENSLDFILVDGMYRDQCTRAALSRLRPGGLLILDNANWYLPHHTWSPDSVGENGQAPTPLWQEVAATLASWRCIWTSNGVWDTAFFVRPPV